MTSSRRSSVLWKEAVQMSDMATNKVRNNLKMGLAAFGDELKRLLIIGIIIPILLTLPALYMQSRWVKYDKIIEKVVTSENTVDPFSNLTEKEMKFIEKMESDEGLYQLRSSLGFASFMLCGFLVALCIGNLMKNFYGAQAEMTFAVPCKKTVLFTAKFLSSTLIIGFVFVLFQIQTILMDCGIVWRDGRFYEIAGSYHMEWTDTMTSFVRAYEPVEINGMPFYFLLVIVAWLGLAFLLSLTGKLQKYMGTIPLALCIGVSSIVVFFASVAGILYGDSYDNVPLMLTAPVVLFVLDLLMIRKYDRVSS